MEKLTAEQATRALFKYRNLPRQATDVIEYLDRQPTKSFLGGFSELARTLKNKQPKNATNYAKMCRLLETLGIITIKYSAVKRPLCIILNENWILTMIGEENETDDNL